MYMTDIEKKSLTKETIEKLLDKKYVGQKYLLDQALFDEVYDIQHLLFPTKYRILGDMKDNTFYYYYFHNSSIDDIVVLSIAFTAETDKDSKQQYYKSFTVDMLGSVTVEGAYNKANIVALEYEKCKEDKKEKDIEEVISLYRFLGMRFEDFSHICSHCVKYYDEIKEVVR